MGKGHRHMKKLKSEKAKVKLKGAKHLPKGTNVTDTNFKVKQIVVRTQLKTANKTEALSKRKLNLKELMSRLQHYNTTAKTDAITDLKEIVTSYPTEVVLPNLNQLIHGVSHLVLDKEKSVRQESLKLISLILAQVSVEQVAPFFDILSSYFRCAMTHIDSMIQEDSLLLLDILLTHVPSLVATHSNKILENFFDLISKLRSDSKPGRTLTLNLDSKLTTVKWRIKVLNRLYSILGAIIKNKQNTKSYDNELTCNFVKHNSKQIFYPVYGNNLPEYLINLNDVVQTKNSNEQENNIVQYVDSLVPLLFETWLEVGPNNKEDSGLNVALTEEGVSVLNCILNIFYLLNTFLQIYGKESGETEIAKNFLFKYRNNFSKFIISYFPYTKIISKKRKRNEKNSEPTNSHFCTTENIMICNLFCIFYRKINIDKKQIENAEKITNYVQDILKRINSENDEQSKYVVLLLKSLLLNVSKSWNCCKDELFNILNSTLDLYSNDKINWKFKCELFNILCEIANYDQFNKSTQFQIWLSTLPNLLCQKEISEKTVNMITLLVKQKNILFNNALKDRFNDILENLSIIKILDTNDELSAKYKIISLVHYLPNENTFHFAKTIASSSCENNLKKYFRDILILKFDERDEKKIVERLRNMNEIISVA